MEMRTELHVNSSTLTIGLQDSVVTIGSCFADAIGNRLHDDKFKILVNPFGTVYNPISIHKLLLMTLNGESPRSTGYCQRDGLFLHHDFHSSYSAVDQLTLQEKLQNQINTVGEWLRTCRVLMITYGTAWVYEQKSTKEIVTNCHKIPQRQFEKFLLTQKRVLESWDIFYARLKAINPAIQILLTVSPVRHVKDTLELNSVSKATLRLTCHTLATSDPRVVYFPAFEMMNDDLRDYRFYESDLIHPNEQAEEYIWQKFGDAFFELKTQQFLERWSKVKVALQHRPFNPSSDSHQKFLQKLLLEVIDLGQFVDVSLERNLIEGQLG
jgi:hypothetical protein